MSPTTGRHDVLVVGGGPAGAATAYWLASAGHDVLVVEKKTFPREKTCGDGLTPRAVRQLHDMGLAERSADFHRFDGLRAIAHGITLELEWPEHPDLPVVRLRGASPRPRPDGRRQCGEGGRDALAGRGGDRSGDRRVGLVRGAVVNGQREVRADYVVIADGANSRFGRALGTARNRAYPQGMAIRGYYESPLHADPWIESALDVRDRNGNALPGYGWIFPVGDGTVNVGVGLLSTFRDYRSVNTTHLLNEYVATAPAYWEISAEPRGRRAHGRPAADGRLGRPQGRPDVGRRRRRGGLRQPVQRRGHRLRVRDRPPRGASAARGAVDRRRPRAAAVPEAARRRVRPLLQGGAALRRRSSAAPR